MTQLILSNAQETGLKLGKDGFLKILTVELDKIALEGLRNDNNNYLLECAYNKGRLLELVKKVPEETYLLPNPIEKILLAIRQESIIAAIEKESIVDRIETAQLETSNIPEGKNNCGKTGKAHITDLKEFDFWNVRYSEFKIEVHFKDKRKTIELQPKDFGRVQNGQTLKKWQWLIIILGGRIKDIDPSKLQDVNDALKIIFDTSIRFFKKNEALPFQVKIERPKFDRRNAANGEYMEERKNALAV